MRHKFESSALWKISIAAGMLLAIFVWMPGGGAQVAAQSGERTVTATVSPAKTIRAARLARPPTLSTEQAQRLEAARAKMHRRGPKTREQPHIPKRLNLPSIPAAHPRPLSQNNLSRPAPRAPDTLTLFTNNPLGAGAPSYYTGVIDEPSAANNGPYVLYSGNWYASFSSDGGNTFGFVNPFTTFPPTYGGFCCDQSVLYGPSRDLMFWVLLYIPNTSGNALRVAVANGQADLSTLTFHYFDFAPQRLGFPAGAWYDYPHVALSNNYLYVSTNVFTRADAFVNTVVLRLPLDGLAGTSGFEYDAYIMDNFYFNATLTYGATTTMYWATHRDTATLRIYQWPESSSTVTATNIAHTAYPPIPPDYNYRCPGPDGRDWCFFRLDDRVMTGWVSNNIIGFMWTAPQGTGGFGTFAYPYVQTILINQTTLALIAEPIMSNPDYAFGYPAAGLNARGHVAGPVFYGGGTLHPTVGIFIWDDLSSPAYPNPPSSWELYEGVAASTQGPNSKPYGQWGDYLASRMNHASPFSRFTWIGTGYTLVGGGDDNDVVPRFLSFGRERDDPATVQANSKFFPIIFR